MKREYKKPRIRICGCALEAGLLIGVGSPGDPLADDSDQLAPMAHGPMFDDEDDLSLGEELDW